MWGTPDNNWTLGNDTTMTPLPVFAGFSRKVIDSTNWKLLL